MTNDSSIQALDRGLSVLRLLARRKTMTACAIAAELGVHQSTASRLLNSLLNAGFVKKPTFHSFALDYGALVFAGQAMHCFPAITASVQVCNRLLVEYGVNAAVAVLHKERLLYLTQCDSRADSALRLINDSGFPVHQSSLGLVIAWSRGRREGRRILKSWTTAAEAKTLFERVDDSIKERGFLLLERADPAVFNAAMPFALDSEPAAFAVFGRNPHVTETVIEGHLRSGVAAITELLEDA